LHRRSDPPNQPYGVLRRVVAPLLLFCTSCRSECPRLPRGTFASPDVVYKAQFLLNTLKEEVSHWDLRDGKTIGGGNLQTKVHRIIRDMGMGSSFITLYVHCEHNRGRKSRTTRLLDLTNSPHPFCFPVQTRLGSSHKRNFIAPTVLPIIMGSSSRLTSRLSKALYHFPDGTG